jgi:hypothetical protein
MNVNGIDSRPTSRHSQRNGASGLLSGAPVRSRRSRGSRPSSPRRRSRRASAAARSGRASVQEGRALKDATAAAPASAHCTRSLGCTRSPVSRRVRHVYDRSAGWEQLAEGRRQRLAHARFVVGAIEQVRVDAERGCGVGRGRAGGRLDVGRVREVQALNGSTAPAIPVGVRARRAAPREAGAAASVGSARSGRRCLVFRPRRPRVREERFCRLLTAAPGPGPPPW